MIMHSTMTMKLPLSSAMMAPATPQPNTVPSLAGFAQLRTPMMPATSVMTLHSTTQPIMPMPTMLARVSSARASSACCASSWELE